MGVLQLVRARQTKTSLILKSILKLQTILILILPSLLSAADPKEIIEGTFNDWLKICNLTDQKCVGVTFAENVSGKRVGRFVLDLVKVDKPEVKAIGTLLIPYETAIPHLLSGIIMQLDQNKPLKERFFFCDKTGCNVRYQFTKSGLDSIKSGSNILIKYKDVRKLNIIRTMDISLNGVKPLLQAIK